MFALCLLCFDLSSEIKQFQFQGGLPLSQREGWFEGGVFSCSPRVCMAFLWLPPRAPTHALWGSVDWGSKWTFAVDVCVCVWLFVSVCRPCDTLATCSGCTPPLAPMSTWMVSSHEWMDGWNNILIFTSGQKWKCFVIVNILKPKQQISYNVLRHWNEVEHFNCCFHCRFSEGARFPVLVEDLLYVLLLSSCLSLWRPENKSGKQHIPLRFRSNSQLQFVILSDKTDSIFRMMSLFSGVLASSLKTIFTW